MTAPAAPMVWIGGPAEFLDRDLDETASVIARWMAARFPRRRAIAISTVARPVGAGMSNETLLFAARWEEDGRPVTADLVLRVGPGAYRLFRDPVFEKQYKLLDLLGRAGTVRVPEMLAFEPDPTLFGAPFYLMARLAGKVPVSFPPYNQAGFLADAAPAERATAWRSALVELTRIHAVPTADVPFLDVPERGATGFDQHVAEWRASYAWATGGVPVPALEVIWSWLEANRPADPVSGLSWGDARIGNMMFADDFTLSGVMDWEQVSLGGAMQDLGWWLFFDDVHSIGIGLTRLDGLGTRADTIALWEERTGRRARDLAWHEVFASFKLGVIAARKNAIENCDAPGHNCNNNVFTRLAADRIGISRPADILFDWSRMEKEDHGD